MHFIFEFANKEPDQYKFNFPSSLSASFIARLEKQNITLKNGLFEKPTEIVIKLGYIKKKKKPNTSLPLKTIFIGIIAAEIIMWLLYSS
jgi:hypothetical protein